VDVEAVAVAKDVDQDLRRAADGGHGVEGVAVAEQGEEGHRDIVHRAADDRSNTHMEGKLRSDRKNGTYIRNRRQQRRFRISQLHTQRIRKLREIYFHTRYLTVVFLVLPLIV
jgi:hypothetical protein